MQLSVNAEIVRIDLWGRTDALCGTVLATWRGEYVVWSCWAPAGAEVSEVTNGYYTVTRDENALTLALAEYDKRRGITRLLAA